MNINESKAVMEKLDGLISAAEEFGNQSEQLSKTRGSFDEYVAAASQAEQRMAAVIEKCNAYVESVQKLLEKDFSSQIDAIVKDTGTAVNACKVQCEEVASEYKKALDLFEQQKPVFEAAQERMLASTETGFNAEQELIKQAAAALEEKSVSMTQELSASVDKVKEELAQNISETSGQSLAEFAELKQANDALQSELSAVKAELSAVKSALETTKAWQIKNELLIKIGLIAASIAAIASIVNLFIK